MEEKTIKNTTGEQLTVALCPVMSILKMMKIPPTHQMTKEVLKARNTLIQMVSEFVQNYIYLLFKTMHLREGAVVWRKRAHGI